KPQDHYKEGDPIRARILRIEDADMKVGLTGINLDDAATSAATAPVAEPAEPAPAAVETASETEEPAPKKKRSRKKAEEAPKE
ncbi:MAG TPA: hypothetical protein VGG65_02215, partial [Thermoanaerobaculia bacterium]